MVIELCKENRTHFGCDFFCKKLKASFVLITKNLSPLTYLKPLLSLNFLQFFRSLYLRIKTKCPFFASQLRTMVHKQSKKMVL
jgi:hypothetical protein